MLASSSFLLWKEKQEKLLKTVLVEVLCPLQSG